MINEGAEGWQYQSNNHFVHQDICTITGLFAMHLVWVDSHGPQTIYPIVLLTSDISLSSTNRPNVNFAQKRSRYP